MKKKLERGPKTLYPAKFRRNPFSSFGGEAKKCEKFTDDGHQVAKKKKKKTQKKTKQKQKQQKKLYKNE